MSTQLIDKDLELKQRWNMLFSTFEQSLNGHKFTPMHGMRQSSMKIMEEMSFPTLRDEDWKYTAVTRILNHKYVLPSKEKSLSADVAAHFGDNLETYKLVFFNGHFRKDLSSELPPVSGLTVCTFEEAMNDAISRDLIDQHHHQWISRQDQIFLHLSTSFSKDNMFIYVPSGVHLDKPIHIVHIVSPADEALMVSPQTLIIAERGSTSRFIETYESENKEASQPVFINALTRIVLNENACVDHFKVQDINSDSFLIHQLDTDQKRDSRFMAFTADLGARIARNEVSAHLKASNTYTQLYGITVGTKDQHTDNMSFIDHAQPRCESREMYKAVLADQSRGVFTGKVIVRPDAQKTNAFQQNNTLLLSQKARMDTKPQLEIFADDVKCSHGATIGQLDRESLFYLMSRGLSRKEAASLLQFAFVAEVLDHLSFPEFEQEIAKSIHEHFNQSSTL